MGKGQAHLIRRRAVERGLPPVVENDATRLVFKSFRLNAEAVVGGEEGKAAAFSDLQGAAVRDGESGPVVGYHVHGNPLQGEQARVLH